MPNARGRTDPPTVLFFEYHQALLDGDPPAAARAAESLKRAGFIVQQTGDAARTLRPDVARALDDLISTTPLPAGFSDHERAKLVLSRVCGFDAPRGKYDSNQFELALRRFDQIVGI